MLFLYGRLTQSAFADVRETERLWKGCDSIARTADRAAARREKDLLVARVTAEFIFLFLRVK
ncbi:hypothetical protein EsDP_00004052 [Epichloe bromicola]|uniref:Uncharacterized protein n=1 Tax=Epichloe bromicola TaxID=79588 RepID=A0ABQ0CQM6_9HYPO